MCHYKYNSSGLEPYNYHYTATLIEVHVLSHYKLLRLCAMFFVLLETKIRTISTVEPIFYCFGTWHYQIIVLN
jgi:hypothetical protein